MLYRMKYESQASDKLPTGRRTHRLTCRCHEHSLHRTDCRNRFGLEGDFLLI